ncbi:MAG: hypothetical protein M3458_03410 [Acidobacteriota bacterium]|nr:hypothetical protein [Acidobacteriota bacterium]
MMREGKPKSTQGITISPMFVTGAVATIVLLVLLGGGHIRRAFVERLNPRITVEARRAPERSRNERGERNAQASAAIFDGEVYRTEARLREAGALAIATGLYGIRAIAERRPVMSVNELLNGVTGRNLVPPGLTLLPDQAAFASAHATLHVRFRPQPFGVEILSVPRERADGACLLVRVPDVDGERAASADTRVRFYQAMRLEGVRLPPPFALTSEIQAHGWTVETMRATLPPDADPQKLATWLRGLNAHQ